MMERLARVFSRRYLPVLCATALVSACSSAVPRHAAAAKDLKFALPSDPTSEGGAFFVSVTSPEPLAEVTGLFQGRVIDFYPDREENAESNENRRYTALIGVEYGTQPGNIDLSVKAKVGGEIIDRRTQVAVKAGIFPSEKLRVPPKTVFPKKKHQKLIIRDRALLHRAYSAKTTTRYWDPPSVMPVDSSVTSVFGTSRVYNGKKENVHFGTDLRAPTGTPIVAPLSGKVAVARDLFYTGNTVILDHGFGFFTIYGHLSKLKIKEGAIIKKGQLMGLSGMTGRASGPHLHWGVNLHGAKVDPLMLMQTLNGARTVGIARATQ